MTAMQAEQGPGERNLPARHKLPGLAVAAINVAIVFHLLALGALALSPMNGPWFVPYLTQQGMPAAGPQFAGAIAQVTTPYYLQPLGLANSYHFESNRTDLPAIYLEEIAQGKDKKEKLPNSGSNMWVRGRQRLLINTLGQDNPFMPRQGGQGISTGDMPKIAFFCHPFDAVIQKLMSPSLKDTPKLATRKQFLVELAKVLNKEELDRYQEEVLGWVEQERFQVAQTKQGFDRSIKQDDFAALNDWLEKIYAMPPPGVPPSHYTIPYMITDKILPSVRSQEVDQKTFYLYECDELNLPKLPQLWTPAPSSLILARSIARYVARQRNETVELVRMNRSPLMPMLMFPNPEAPGKLLFDVPPQNYNLEIVYHNLGNGQPKPWLPK
jgi:hypothetical protein